MMFLKFPGRLWFQRLVNLVGEDYEVYVSPLGSHFHSSRDCSMLSGEQYEDHGYYPVKLVELDRRKWRMPCACVDRLVQKLIRKEAP